MDRTAAPDGTPAWGRRARPADRRSVAGRTYLLGIATLYRRAVFDDEEAARAVARLHALAWPWRDAQVLAWVLLPDRWQALVRLGERDSLPTLVGRFKALTSRAVEPRHRINGHVWGRGFTDRALADADDPRAVARLLIAQPVRAGLASCVGDYAYWDAAWLPGGNGA
jgi:REP element-mobilizing transposase RayT